MTSSFEQKGWEVVAPVSADASARTYSRMQKGKTSAILMDASAVPERDVDTFMRLADWLRARDVRTPEIYERENGYLLLEDFGDMTMRRALDEGGDAPELYAKAAELIQHMEALSDLPPLPDFLSMPIYDAHRQAMDWYVPLVRGLRNTSAMVAEYRQAWQQVEAKLPRTDKGFLHADYHPANLMVLEDGSLGVLDFQDACYGPLAYDWCNLLYDARCDVPEAIRRQWLKGRDEEFMIWFDFLTLQFHLRVIGLFIKLPHEMGKNQYLQYIPYLESRIKEELKNPLFSPLQQFFESIKVDFGGVSDFNSERIAALVRVT